MEEEDDCMYAGEQLRKSFVQEWGVLRELVQSIEACDGIAEPEVFEKAKSIIERYQEQGHLLEPHLEGIIVPLMELLRSVVARNVRKADMDIVKRLCCLIHKLITVCSHKTVVKFFPHQACDLEATVALLERCHNEFTCGNSLDDGTGEWETKCTLVLWLSILVLIPFDIVSVDTYSKTTDSSPLVETILKLCKEYLSSSGPVRDMAAVLLSKLLTRPDMHNYLNSFLRWSEEALAASQETAVGVFLVPGTASALACIFKVGGRDILQSIAAPVWQEVSTLASSKLATRSPLLRKLLIKLTQRIGLTYLSPKLPAWRYMRGTKSLIHNLEDAKITTADDGQEEQIECDVEEAVPEVIEDVMEKLLAGLKDKDTVVRWSAAKGVGRVTSRLSSENADDVVASVLELFSPTEGDGAWHGGCLALAELARRGLLLPKRLTEVMPYIIKALHYDVRRGPHSVGAHVRDAAAYVCWAFARAYSPNLMSSHFKQLAPSILATACFDREVNCRRAASAAFQENVGRQGDFLHGIDIVNVSDYFSIGSRSQAYQQVAPYIAQFEEYRNPLIEDLLLSKIRHWDKGLREVAGVGLALLVQYDPNYFENTIISQLISWSLSPDLNLRHGATLAAAEVIRALHECNYKMQAKEKEIANMVPAIERARLYRGKGGEIMRAAVSRLIECTALARIPLSPKTRKILLDTLDDNLKHPSGSIQVAAAAGFGEFVKSYLLPVTPNSIACTTAKHLQDLVDSNPAKRRGSALAIGALPYELLKPVWKDVIHSLCSASIEANIQEDRDPEARVNAVRALSNVCNVLFDHRTEELESIESFGVVLNGEVVTCLLEALNDYAVDNRGDVGSWVREACMEALHSSSYILHQLSTPHSCYLSEPLITKIIGGLLKQAAEKIDRIRETAGKTLQRILHYSIPCIPHKQELEQIFPEHQELAWADPALAYPRLVQLIKLCEYRPYVVSGLVISVGGLSQTLGKVSLASLLDWLHQAPSPSSFSDFVAELVNVMNKNAGNDRVILPTIKTIDALALKNVENVNAVGILESVVKEVKGCKDVAKIVSVMSVLSTIASLQLPCSKQALAQLVSFLTHRYPKVRKVGAEQLYLVMMEEEEEGRKGLDLLVETCWDGPLETIKEEKEKLMTLFQLDDDADSSLAMMTCTHLQSAACDENASYASLVDSAGY